jgi:hypothetical protein
MLFGAITKTKKVGQAPVHSETANPKDSLVDFK